MPQQTDPAVPMRLSIATSQHEAHLPLKIRVAGRLGRSYEPTSELIELTDGKCSLLVDISLCLEPFNSSPWLVGKHALVMFVGYLEPFSTQIVNQYTAGDRTGYTVVLRALIAQETSDLQLSLWDRAIQEREALESLRS